MNFDICKMGRKILSLFLAIVCYYIVHEGAHLIFAICTGTFEKIVFMFPGVQIKANVELLTDAQLFVFNLLGTVSTLVAAYILCGSSRRVVRIKSNVTRAILYYITVVLLMCDPIYLSVASGFFGGGDMNGITIFIPELLARLTFGAIGIANLVVIIKLVVPTYKKSFEQNNIDIHHCE